MEISIYEYKRRKLILSGYFKSGYSQPQYYRLYELKSNTMRKKFFCSSFYSIVMKLRRIILYTIGRSQKDHEKSNHQIDCCTSSHLYSLFVEYLHYTNVDLKPTLILDDGYLLVVFRLQGCVFDMALFSTGWNLTDWWQLLYDFSPLY